MLGEGDVLHCFCHTYSQLFVLHLVGFLPGPPPLPYGDDPGHLHTHWLCSFLDQLYETICQVPLGIRHDVAVVLRPSGSTIKTE